MLPPARHCKHLVRALRPLRRVMHRARPRGPVNRLGVDGASGLPWVRCSRDTGNQATVSVSCRVSNSTGAIGVRRSRRSGVVRRSPARSARPLMVNKFVVGESIGDLK